MIGRIEHQSFWILLGAGFILFLFTIWVAIVNRGSEYSYQVLKPIWGGIGVSLLLLMTMLLSAPDSYARATDVLILAKTSRQIVPLEQLTMRKYGFSIYSGYQQLVNEGAEYWKSTQGQEDLTNLPANEFLQYQELSKYLLELAEWSTMTWIVFAYPAHWQMEHEWFDAISSGVGQASVKSTADPRDIMEVDICDLLQENRFAKFYKNREPRRNHLLVPRGSSVEFKKLSEMNHALLINTRHSVIEIGFRTDFGGMIGMTDLAEAIEKEFGPAWNDRIIVSFKITPKRLYQWSKNSQTQQQWIRELSKFYDDSFAWNHLKKKLEDALKIQGYWQGFWSSRGSGGENVK